MKTKSIVITFALTLGFLTSCDHETIRAADEISSLNYSIHDYSALRVSDEFNIYITFSDAEESIRIEANDNLHDRIIVKKEGSALVIKLKNFTSIRGNATMNAHIVTKNVSNFDISGASHLFLENKWVVEDGQIDLSGASEVSGEVNTNRLNLDMSCASYADLFGSAFSVNADLSGSSTIGDYDLAMDNLKIELSGASKAFVTVNKTIEVEASGVSVLNYMGNAEIVHKDLSGAAKIKNRN